MEESQLVYIHSRCCGGHWAVVWNKKGYFLECPQCGKSAGLEVVGIGEPEDGKSVCFHSCCCDAHWELVYDGQYHLLCEKCQEPSGCLIVVGPHLDNPKCDCCENSP